MRPFDIPNAMSEARNLIVTGLTPSTCPHPLYFNLLSLLSRSTISFQLNCAIMRKNSYSPAKPFFVPASKRRRVDTGPAGSPQNRPGFIDQKLIEGSQQPRSSNSISRESSPPLDPLSSLLDEDPQFDAFGKLQLWIISSIVDIVPDLGLLAEESELGSLHTRHIPSAQMTPPRGAFASNARLENAPPQRSRFFNREYPLHVYVLVSLQSDADIYQQAQM